jgi:hypothetical protein
MANPYWETKGKGHFIDLHAVRQDCFELLNIFEANKALHDDFELMRAEAQEVDDIKLQADEEPLLRLHLEYAEKRISQLLLAITLSVRTYDDILLGGDEAKSYRTHSQTLDAKTCIGVCSDTKEFGLRVACNKIIHAADV